MTQLFFGIKALVLNDEGKFLAVHKTKQASPLLEIPGGRMEFGETIEETLICEMKEETNLVVAPKKILTTWNYMKKTGDFQVAGLIYLVEVEDLSSLTLSEEHDSCTWLGFDELNLLVPHFKNALENIECSNLF
ncbi:NUDIX domain-containing protein [Streptococcus sp. S784/96/1]|uniref:NUDIX domain-containing protein n=1 Tax=Streptococcus sp. S784/96/1 TaxID=2653499 RepID=UPI001386EBD1|nr:NUDIX domain-containing protein [Streptococcus sp. S784/96/1]